MVHVVRITTHDIRYKLCAKVIATFYSPRDLQCVEAILEYPMILYNTQFILIVRTYMLKCGLRRLI